MNEKRKLDLIEKSDIYKGFTREELHEILIEAPLEKQIEKDKKKEARDEPKQPQFDNFKLVQLDGLHDIATRGQIETR